MSAGKAPAPPTDANLVVNVGWSLDGDPNIYAGWQNEEDGTFYSFSERQMEKLAEMVEAMVALDPRFSYDSVAEQTDEQEAK